MSSRRMQPAISMARKGLRAVAFKLPVARRAMEATRRELTSALADGVYGGRYYGDDRDPTDRMGLSGYERYDRQTSNADVAAYLLWRFFPITRSLDVGCALGFVVEALRELGIEADGTDVSQYAVDHATPGAVGHLRRGDLLSRLPYSRGQFDVVSALEVLEHIGPDDVPRALTELHRVCRGWLVCTIPSVGPNEHGPGGWFNAKVRDDVLPRYLALGDDYDGPVPFDDLVRDAAGDPLEGHLTVASFRWWTERFTEAGFERCGEMERLIHPLLARFGLTKFWNLYVLKVPGTPMPDVDGLRTPSEIDALEHRWKLDQLVADPHDIESVRRSVELPVDDPAN
jgi:SAM-dependent methyltransferase